MQQSAAVRIKNLGRAEGVLSVLSRPLQISIWTDGVLSFIPPEEREIEKEGEREILLVTVRQSHKYNSSA